MNNKQSIKINDSFVRIINYQKSNKYISNCNNSVGVIRKITKIKKRIKYRNNNNEVKLSI